MNIVSIINWKGRVGKTTITHHLAAALQALPIAEVKELTGLENRPRVLLIDRDPQCSLSISALGEDKFETMAFEEDLKTVKDLFAASLEGQLPMINIEDYIIKKAVRSREDKVYSFIDLIPSHPDLIYTDMNIAAYSKPNFRSKLLNSDIYKFQIIDEIINKISNYYDFIFIDCPPNLNFITQNALYKSNFYLIPTILDKLSSYGILSITNKVDELNDIFSTAVKDYTKTELIGIVPNNVREYGGIPKQSQSNILNRLTTLFGNIVFDTYLTNGDGIAQASELSYPVFALEGSMANASKQSDAVREISREFLNRL